VKQDALNGELSVKGRRGIKPQPSHPDDKGRTVFDLAQGIWDQFVSPDAPQQVRDSKYREKLWCLNDCYNFGRDVGSVNESFFFAWTSNTDKLTHVCR
jgi:hypothetical protein